MTNFILNSFHVLLAALWGKGDPEQVNTEEWFVDGKRFTAYIGNFGTRSFDGGKASVPPKLFDTIQETIRLESLVGEVRWFRFFCCALDNSFTFEALKDNELWASGVRCLKAAGWEPSSQYYSVRLLIVLCAV